DGADGKLLRLFGRQAGALGGNGRRYLFQAVLAHSLGEDGVSIAKRIDAVDEVDVEVAHVHRKSAHAVDQGGVGYRLGAVAAEGVLLGLLRDVESGDGVLAHGLLIFLVQLGVLVLDNLAHANLGQFFGHQLVVEQAALKRGLVLHKGGDHLVQVLLADARRFRALGLREAPDLDLVMPRLLVNANIALRGVVAAGAVVEARRGAVLDMFRPEFEARRKHLLHQQARSDGLKRVVHRLGHDFLGGVRLGDQVGEARPCLARRVAGGAANDLDDFGEARTVANGQRVFAPNPIEAFLCHAERNDDVHIVAVVLLRRVFQRGRYPVAPGNVVIHEVGNAQDAAARNLDKLEPGLLVHALPFTQGFDDVLHLPHLVLRALARIHVGDMDDSFLARIEHLEDVIDVGTRIEKIADVELLQEFIAIELFVIGVSNSVELGLVLRGEHGFRVAPKVRAGHGDYMHTVAGDELPEVSAELVVGVGGNVMELVHSNQPAVELLDAELINGEAEGCVGADQHPVGAIKKR